MKKVLAELIGKIRPNALILAGGIFIVALVLMDSVKDELVPNEAFWIGLGVLLGGLVQALTKLMEPDPAPSVPAALAEKMIDKLSERCK